MIAATIDSISAQSAQPEFIIVVNDGSSDNTEQIVLERANNFKPIYVLNTNSKTRDIRRVPRLLDLGMEFSQKLPKTRYMMVSGDDNALEKDYARKIMDRMERDGIDVASGDWISSGGRSNQMPHGGGRFVSTDLMIEIGGKYPVAYGWETWLLYKALQLNRKVRLYKDVRYKHLRPFRPSNLFNWGRAMYSLGFPTYYVCMRFAINLLWSSRGTQSIKASLTMIVGYFQAAINPGALQGLLIEDEGLKTFVRRFSTARLTKLL